MTEVVEEYEEYEEYEEEEVVDEVSGVFSLFIFIHSCRFSVVFVIPTLNMILSN